MTILLEILVIAAIAFGVVAWGLGAMPGLRGAPPDSGDVGLPPGRLGPEAVDRTRFGLAFRGYRMAEVDEVLDRLRDELAERDRGGATEPDLGDVPIVGAPGKAGPIVGAPGEAGPVDAAPGTEPVDAAPGTAPVDAAPGGAGPVDAASDARPAPPAG